MINAPSEYRARRNRSIFGPAAGGAVAAWLGVLILPLVPTGPAGAQLVPAVGTFLVASRELRGSGFSESIVLIIQHDRDGTMGLIINQPTGTRAADLLPEIPELDAYDSKLYIGGPVATWGVIMLVQSTGAPANALHVFDNVYTSGDIELLGRLVESGLMETDVRLYAGHAGWLPGQLDAEIERGSWFVVPARSDMVFSSRPDEIWDQLIGTGEIIIVEAGVQKHTHNAISPGLRPDLSGHFPSAAP